MVCPTNAPALRNGACVLTSNCEPRIAERQITGRSMAIKARGRKVQLILNGKVAGNDALRSAVAQQQAVGHRIDVRVTSEKGDARRFVARADKVDLLIAAGGDGTLNEVVHGLVALSAAGPPGFGVL